MPPRRLGPGRRRDRSTPTSAAITGESPILTAVLVAKDQRDLDDHGHQFEAAERLGAKAQDHRDEQAEEDGRKVDRPTLLGTRGERRRQAQAEALQDDLEVAGDADRDHGHDRDVFQQQVPPDEPGDELT
jgi:hypothetical protein